MNNTLFYLKPTTKRAAYSSEPVPLLSDKQNISNKQTVYQNCVLFCDHTTFETNMTLTQITRPPPHPLPRNNSTTRGRARQFENLGVIPLALKSQWYRLT
jgi:hypothetical protein